MLAATSYPLWSFPPAASRSLLTELFSELSTLVLPACCITLTTYRVVQRAIHSGPSRLLHHAHYLPSCSASYPLWSFPPAVTHSLLTELFSELSTLVLPACCITLTTYRVVERAIHSGPSRLLHHAHYLPSCSASYPLWSFPPAASRSLLTELFSELSTLVLPACCITLTTYRVVQRAIHSGTSRLLHHAHYLPSCSASYPLWSFPPAASRSLLTELFSELSTLVLPACCITLTTYRVVQQAIHSGPSRLLHHAHYLPSCSASYPLLSFPPAASRSLLTELFSELSTLVLPACCITLTTYRVVQRAIHSCPSRLLHHAHYLPSCSASYPLWSFPPAASRSLLTELLSELSSSGTSRLLRQAHYLPSCSSELSTLVLPACCITLTSYRVVQRAIHSGPSRLLHHAHYLPSCWASYPLWSFPPDCITLTTYRVV